MEKVYNRFTAPKTSGEINSGVHLTQDDLSMTISEIMVYAEENSSILEPIKEQPYELDLTDIYPNINELGDTDINFNKVVEQNTEQNEDIEQNNKDTENPARHNENNKE